MYLYNFQGEAHDGKNPRDAVRVSPHLFFLVAQFFLHTQLDNYCQIGFFLCSTRATCISYMVVNGKFGLVCIRSIITLPLNAIPFY